MAKKKKIVITAVFIFMAVVIVWAVKVRKDQKASSIQLIENSTPVVVNVQNTAVNQKDSQDQKIIRIVEFIDFQCPACANGAQYLRSIKKQFPSRVDVQMKNFPLNFHEHSVLAATYAECAEEQGKFWTMHDFLIDQQSKWASEEIVDSIFNLMAIETGLDNDLLQSCLASPKTAQSILDDKAEGKILGVKSTPTYFINGVMFVGSNNLKTEMEHLLGISKDENK